MTAPAENGMDVNSDESRSWCSAAPMVRISANTSKPSNVHPRFEAISAFHCVRLSKRYHGEYPKVADSLMIPSMKFAKGGTSCRQPASQAYDQAHVACMIS